MTLLVWHRYGMEYDIYLDGATRLNIWTYDDRQFGGNSRAEITQQGDRLLFTCHFNQKYIWPFCGFNIDVDKNWMDGYDLSDFERVEIDIQTNGEPMKPIRIFLRTAHPAYSQAGDFSSLKVNELHYDPNEEGNPFVADLDSFQVATWWINENNIPPEHAAPDLGNVVNIGFGLSQHAEEKKHGFTFRSIRFHGKWIGQNRLQSIIIAAWLGSAALFVLLYFWHVKKDMSSIKRQKRELEEVNVALKLERNELETLVSRDSLTGVHNRAGLRNQLHMLTSLAKHKQTDLSVIFIDIDRFKEVNDSHGHDTGDRILIEFAQLVDHNIRTQDLFCRWGGDEFILLCHGTPLDAGMALANKLRHLIIKRKWPADIDLTCSFGVAQMHPDESIDAFFKRADQALYQAKAAGRNCVGPVAVEDPAGVSSAG